jgi:hypothetical protein
MLKKDRGQQRGRGVKLQALDVRDTPGKYQVFRAKCTLGMGTVTQLLAGPVQSQLPRCAKTEQRVSLLIPALEGPTWYCFVVACAIFCRVVRCPRGTQAPTDQSSRSFTSFYLDRKKQTHKQKPKKHSIMKAAGTCGISWPPLRSQLLALTSSNTVELLNPRSSLILNGMFPCLPRHF